MTTATEKKITTPRKPKLKALTPFCEEPEDCPECEDTEEPCAVCADPVSVETGLHSWVHVINDGECFAKPRQRGKRGGDCGWFPVCPKCEKKHSAALSGFDLVLDEEEESN